MEEEGEQFSDINRQTIFIGCVIALVATAFYFGIRNQLLSEWQELYDISNERLGYIQGAGLLPFAITIILFSLIVDEIGYGVSMAIAFTLHILSALLTLSAPLVPSDYGTFVMLYVGTFTFALGNGTVEAVINPVVATMFPKEKPKYLSILHSGWPLGLVFGALMGIAPLYFPNLADGLPGHLWVWRVSLMIIPMLIYGYLLFGEKFPVHERVEAGVSYLGMLKEFGWGSALIVFFLLSAAVTQILTVVKVVEPSPTLWGYWAVIAVGLTIPFGAFVKSFGRPLFVVLMTIMGLVATMELGGDSWMPEIIGAVEGPKAGAVLFAWMAFIMWVLRFYASDILEILTPLGVLAIGSIVACAGLLGISWAEGLFLMALVSTVYGVGKTFFWPAMIGIVGDQFPKGGALTLNAIAGVGMVFAGAIGTPGIGYVQDYDTDQKLSSEVSESVKKEITKQEASIFGSKRVVDADAIKKREDKEDKDPRIKQEIIENEDKAVEVHGKIQEIQTSSKQKAIRVVAILPAILFFCYLLLILYFRSTGGYKTIGIEDGEGEDGSADS